MKNLISYIKESLLDDEDVLMKDDNKQVYNSLLPQDWEIYKDSDYIIPKKMDSNPFNLVLYKSDFDKIKSLNSTDLKFTPLKNLLIVDTNSLNLPLVISTINLTYMNTDNHPLDLDFNKVNYNIDSIQIMTTKIGKIIPYKKRINCVQFFASHIRSNEIVSYKKDSICGWDCEHLLVYCDWDVSKNGSLNKEEIQNLVDNNPKATKIYIYVRKERVRQLLLNDDRVIIGEYTMNYDEFRKIQSKIDKKYDRDIHKWLKSHHILVECCNAIPSDTIGMGNPIPPTDDSIGTEPLVLRRKKRMNKIKKES